MRTKKPKVAAVVLAAGRSRRMGAVNKLTSRMASKTVLEHVIDNLQRSCVDQIVVVLGHEAEIVSRQVVDPGIICLINDRYTRGMGQSIKVGVKQINMDYDAVIIVPGDMPFIGPSVIDQLIEAYDGSPAIIVPRYQGKPGNPLLWSRDFYRSLEQLDADQGGKQIIGTVQDNVINLEVDSVGILVDIDDPQTLTFFKSIFSKE